MERVSITVNKQAIGKLEHSVFSSFIEHIGRAVYGGIYQPDHISADENGFRKDVIELVRDLNIDYVRYPGGNFVSGYNWKNGIGKREHRPCLPDLAWKQMEPNEVGVDEFLQWSEAAGVQPMMAVNLGTGTPQEALELLEYCNGTAGYWAEQRKKNGRVEPYGIKYWCMGNEMDGEWQIGHKSCEDYVKIALTAARMMKAYDPSIKVIFCGSSAYFMPTFPEWDRYVIRKCYREIDYISSHTYYSFPKNEPGASDLDFRCSYYDFDRGIAQIRKIIEEVSATMPEDRRKPIGISVDEWNIWYRREGADWDNVWTVAPRREESVYSSLDAVVISSLMTTLFNNCDTVKIACIAQLVNVIAPILTDYKDKKEGRAIRQAIYFPFQYASRYAKGNVLSLDIGCGVIDSPKYGKVKDFCASLVESEDEYFLLLCNLSDREKEVELSVGCPELIDGIRMTGKNGEYNSFENPDKVVPVKITDAKEAMTLPPVSFHMLRLRKVRES